MSAFICSDRHIATIAVAYSKLTGEDPQPIADELAQINVDSVNYRYEDTTPYEQVDLTEAVDIYQPNDLVALCKCLDYQSCERPDYSNPLLERIAACFEDECKHDIKSPIWSI